MLEADFGPRAAAWVRSRSIGRPWEEYRTFRITTLCQPRAKLFTRQSFPIIAGCET